MRKLLLVALLAILVTGGIAAVYRGPIHPPAEDANAAAKAERTKSHVMFDPSEYAADGKPAPESFLKAFHLDLAYWRNRLLPPTTPQAPPATTKTETQPRASKPTETNPPPPPASRAAQPQPQAAREPPPSSDTPDPMSEAFLMAGIPPALATQTALRTGSFAGALSPAARQIIAATYFDQNSTYDELSYSSSDIFISSWIQRRAQELPSLTTAIPRPYLNFSWSRYFVLSSAPASFPPDPDDSPTQSPEAVDPFFALNNLQSSRSMPLGDATLNSPLTDDPVPEPGTFLLCGIALALLVHRRSHPV